MRDCGPLTGCDIGDVVRYKPNSLLINTAEALKEIHSLSSASKYIKSKAYAPMVHRAPNTLTIRGGKDHARRRRIMAQGVSEKAQRGYEGRVMDHINRFCDTAFSAETAGQPMDMAKWTNYLSFDIMADVVFGAQYRLLGNERFRYGKHMKSPSGWRDHRPRSSPSPSESTDARMHALLQWSSPSTSPTSAWRP